MQMITVTLGAHSYSILVESGIGNRLEEYLPENTGTVLVTSPTIHELYGDKIAGQVEEVIQVPDGEEAKQWNMVEKLLGRFLEAGLDRDSVVVAFGGGCVGDLAGFASSIYMRGINLVHVPTTLLAMVDSSIGGKTAVNHPLGKNLVGSFHQPHLVLIDPVFLQTLPIRETRSGFAEIIKYGVISDPDLFAKLESNKVETLSQDDLTDIISRCVFTKARYVEQDVEDRLGVRAALNYGHTVGHALELLSHHDLNHGEGVAVGMIAAAYIAREQNLLNRRDYQRITELIDGYGLPTRVPTLDLDAVIEVMHRDKKAQAGEIYFILPTGIGSEPVMRKVDDDGIRAALEALT
jgi:3-dehydroquinate synthase